MAEQSDVLRLEVPAGERAPDDDEIHHLTCCERHSRWEEAGRTGEIRALCGEDLSNHTYGEVGVPCALCYSIAKAPLASLGRKCDLGDGLSCGRYG